MNAQKFHCQFLGGRPIRLSGLRPHCIPHIYCNDGFKVSVQVGEFAYCTPRNNYGPWYKVELGFPSEEEPLIMDYVEDPSRPTETVYGYVPLDLVMEVFDKHGGIDFNKTRHWSEEK